MSGSFRTGFFEADNPWRQITHMVEQFLNVECWIFPNWHTTHHLQELYSLNCKLDDIAERRRDYRRTPYSTALQENLPIRLEHSYLRKVLIQRKCNIWHRCAAAASYSVSGFSGSRRKAPRKRPTGLNLSAVFKPRSQSCFIIGATGSRKTTQ
ncbi:MAG: hypothetical protein R3F53_28990 [Gammaproteobacteria bacterium]